MTSEFWEQLDDTNDEAEVRRRIAEGLYSHRHLGIAQEWIHRRDETRAVKRHDELIAEVKRPHWSVTPSFYLLVLSVVLTAAALFVAVTQQLQVQSPAAVAAPSKQTALPAPDSSSSYHMQSPPASPQSPAPPKK